MPLPDAEKFVGTNVTEQGFKDAQIQLINYLGVEVPTRAELKNETENKVEKSYVDNALSSLQNGALKTYPTLAAANADIANIALNTKVEVLSAENGGSYYKESANAITLTKSPYDAKNQAVTESKEYTDEKTEQINSALYIDAQDAIYYIVDAFKNIVAYISADGVLHSNNDFKTFDGVSLKNINQDVSILKSKISNVEINDYAFALQDVLGNYIATLKQSGDLNIPNLRNSVQDNLSSLAEYRNFTLSALAFQSADNSAKSRFTDFVIKAKNLKTIANNLRISSYGEGGSTTQRIPVIYKLTSNSAILFFNRGVKGWDGDGRGVELYKCFVTWDEQFNITKTKPVLFYSLENVFPGAAVKHPQIGKTQNGKLVLLLETRTTEAVQYDQKICFSNDNGQTWTDPVSVVFNTPKLTDRGTLVLGTGSKIITLSSGRLVTSAYYADNNTQVLLYSDDQGATWSFSNIVENTHSSETALIQKSDGKILILARREDWGAKVKRTLVSVDGSDLSLTQDSTLACTDCQTSITKLSDGTLVAANPFPFNDSNDRIDFRTFFSFDDGKSWDLIQHRFYQQKTYGGYSSIENINDKAILVALEGVLDEYVLNEQENIEVYIVNLPEVFKNGISS
ncbi:sialidase family protein [Acinetobacter bereziniae]|uniref:sialidase family protein n=1 Tax=Acinetobacter bereziniae TaxID=106648 RepID=UPI003019D7B4